MSITKHSRPGLFGLGSLLEPNTESLTGVVHIASDVNTIGLDSKQIRSCPLHLEHLGTGRGSPGDITFSSPAPQCREDVF